MGTAFGVQPARIPIAAIRAMLMTEITVVRFVCLLEDMMTPILSLRFRLSSTIAENMAGEGAPAADATARSMEPYPRRSSVENGLVTVSSQESSQEWFNSYC